MTRVLIAEDDPLIAEGLQDDLVLEGYEVIVEANGLSASKRATKEPFNLFVLDVMLPGRDGFDICRDIRGAGISTPILILTARAQEMEKVYAFEMGADDYVTKPFGTKELRARIKALLRRSSEGSGIPKETDIARIADIELDFTKGEVRRDGHAIDITLTEFKLLSAFVRNRGRVLGRQQLLDAAWGPGTVLSDRTVDNHIVNLRRKIEPDPAEPRYLVSVRGLGYRLDA
jgi:DNA-binding response OmpR family regulator